MRKQKTAITPTREENFSGWYQNVITEADLAENSPVRGCMTIKPYGFAIWELLRDQFDAIIKDNDVQNAYFPLLIPLDYMTREAAHVDGFAKECAIVTHYKLKDNGSGEIIPDENAKLAEPYIIRPTSETVIGEAMSRWITSYRDLPMKLNQWANVMRWEMRTRMFLRTSEFLWQEGHNAFTTAEEANKDALKMLNVYHDFAEKFLSIPTIKGVKTAEERFPGADQTYTFEAMMQDGKALQSGTTHDLGQHFSKSFGITFANKEGKEENAYTTSWGISTRLIGGMIMTHADDNGLVLPVKIAPQQVVIIPFIKNEEDKVEIEETCKKIKAGLKSENIRVLIDNGYDSSINKIWKWVKKGAPVRIEVGKRDIDNGEVLLKRRDMHDDKSSAIKLSLDSKEIGKTVLKLLEDIHNNMLNKVLEYRKNKTKTADSLSQMEGFFANNFEGFVIIPLSETEKSEYEAIADKYKLTRRCILLDNQEKVIIAKSY